MSAVCQKIRAKARAALKAQQPYAPVIQVHKHSQTRVHKYSPAQSSKQVVSTQKTILEEATAQGQVIDQQQSLELMQTMLLVSISSFCFLRGILPANHFEDRSYNSICENNHCSYKDFLGGKVAGNSLTEQKLGKQPNRQSSTSNTDMMKVLARGSSRSTDKILFWMDGIFEALKRNILEAVQFCVVLDKDKPGNVVESYSFAFEYTANTNSADTHVKSMLFTGSGGDPVTITSARADIAKINRTLIVLSRDLPHLPATRYLTCNLSYTWDCPIDFTPPGFYLSKSETVFVPDSDLWRMEQISLGQMNSGYYRVGLKGAHILPVDNLNLESKDRYLQIPSKLDYPRQMSRFEYTVIDDNSKSRTFPSATKVGGLGAAAEGSQIASQHGSVSCNLYTRPIDDLEARTKRQLQKMAQAPSLSEGLIQTQPVVVQSEDKPWSTDTIENLNRRDLAKPPMDWNQKEMQESHPSDFDTTEGESDELVGLSFPSRGPRHTAKSKSELLPIWSKVSSNENLHSPRPMTRSQKKRLREEETLTARKRNQSETSPLSTSSFTY